MGEEKILDSDATTLSVHSCVKWREENRSHYSSYRMHLAVVPSASIHMSGQTDLIPAPSILKNTMNMDIHATFVRTWTNSLSEASLKC